MRILYSIKEAQEHGPGEERLYGILLRKMPVGKRFHQRLKKGCVTKDLVAGMSYHRNNLCVSPSLFLGLGINKNGSCRFETLKSLLGLHFQLFS